ncbi:MAG: GH25 family lysozyme [Arcanobacterium sp.]|nr:GH25 family lysozyme [Arcanobacterium sp.]
MKKNVRANLLAVASLALSLSVAPLCAATPAVAAPATGITPATSHVVAMRAHHVKQEVPSEGDIAAAKGAEQKTQSSIADIEVQLANLSAHSLRAQQEVATAQKTLEQAQAAAQKAAQESEQAKQQAVKAQKAVEAARANMAAIAQAIYQNSATNLTTAYYLFDANSLADASAHDRAFNVVADSADAKVKSFKAMQDVAANLKKRAAQKAAEQAKLMEAADVAADNAAAAAEAAQAEEVAAEAQRDALLDQLAKQKNTTKSLESQRFQALEEQRIAREKAAAAARAQAEAQARAQAEVAAKAAAARNRSVAPVAPTQKATPAPTPAPKPAPAPVRGTKPVIDLSSWQSPSLINYDALARSVSGVILRIGFTGSYSGSSLNKDSAFDRHYAEFTRRGVPVGAYWYSAANEGNEGANEARAALQFLGGRRLSFPLYIDVEDPTHQSWASMATLTDQTLKFASVARSGGYRPGVYASSSWYYSKLNYGVLTRSGLAIWVAQWSSYRPGFSYGLWQYTDSARLNGYPGRLDANVLG